MRVAKDEKEAMAVMTAVTAKEIISRGGSGDWILNPDKASGCRYLVCCRKAHWNNREEGISNGTAFLVGKIKNLVPGVTNARGQRRYFIALSEYATVSKSDVWGEWRNPIRYGSLEDFELQAAKLKFTPLPARGGKEKTPASPSPGALTIAQAKQALAATFGVSPEDVEITIRG